jgi:hypothetical protein
MPTLPALARSGRAGVVATLRYGLATPRPGGRIVLTISSSRSMLAGSTQCRGNSHSAALQSDISDMAFTLLRLGFVTSHADSLAPIQTEVVKPLRKNSKTFPN